METIVAALITALVTMIGSFLIYNTKVVKMTQQLINLNKNSTNLKTDNEKNFDERKTEHKYLSGEHKDLAEKLTEIDKQLAIETAKKGVLAGKELDIKNTVTHITALCDKLAQQKILISDLQAENEALHIQLAALQPQADSRWQYTAQPVQTEDNEQER